MAVDLHTHSSESDGTDRPSTLIAKADSLGLVAVALTDHDTLAGIAEAQRAADASSIDLVPGTELSVTWPTGKMHLLVLFLEPGSGPLQDRLAGLRDGRTVRNEKIIGRLRSLGYPLTMDDVLEHAGGEAVGRPHIADALIERGHFANRAEAFETLLGDGRPAYVERRRLTAHEAIRLARESEALTSIAHPYTVGVSRDDYGRAFAELAAEGLTAIESHHTEHAPELRDHLAVIAADLGLLTTGGSDYHGAGKEGVELGRGRGDLDVPDEFYFRLQAARAGLGDPD